MPGSSARLARGAAVAPFGQTRESDRRRRCALLAAVAAVAAAVAFSLPLLLPFRPLTRRSILPKHASANNKQNRPSSTRPA